MHSTDYSSWLKGFTDRKESQYKYDKGKVDMVDCTKEWFERLIRRHQYLAHEDDQYIFGVFEKETNAHLGMVNVAVLARDTFQWADLGYFIHNQHWNNGYEKESVSALIDLCFTQLNLHRLEAHINTENSRSEALAKTVGFSFEGIREKFIYEDDQWEDQLVYYILNHNWKEN